MADEQPQTAAAKQLLLQKIYVKDLSFESPKAPSVFTTNVQPQTQISIRTGSQTIAQNTFEVTLTLTVEAKEQDATIFLCEIAQFIDRNGCAEVRVNQKAAFGQKATEQHAMPKLIGGRVLQSHRGHRTGRIARISERARVRPQTTAQQFVII